MASSSVTVAPRLAVFVAAARLAAREQISDPGCFAGFRKEVARALPGHPVAAARGDGGEVAGWTGVEGCLQLGKDRDRELHSDLPGRDRNHSIADTLVTNRGSIAMAKTGVQKDVEYNPFAATARPAPLKHHDLFNRLSEALLANDAVSHSANHRFNIVDIDHPAAAPKRFPHGVVLRLGILRCLCSS